MPRQLAVTGKDRTMARNLYGTDNSEILHGTSGHWPDGDAIWGYGGDDEIYAGDGWDYLTAASVPTTSMAGARSTRRSTKTHQ
jgi:hypothetical protein